MRQGRRTGSGQILPAKPSLITLFHLGCNSNSRKKKCILNVYFMPLSSTHCHHCSGVENNMYRGLCAALNHNATFREKIETRFLCS